MGDKMLAYTELRYGVRFGPIGALMNVLFMRRKLRKGLVNGLAGLDQHVKTGELIGVDYRSPVAS